MMKVALSRNGNDLDSATEKRFWRVSEFLIVDDDSLELDYLDNSAGVNASHGAGIQTSRLVADAGAKAGFGAGRLARAQLFPGEENSGKLVSRLRQEARRLAEPEGIDLVLADGPPGIGCPVISSLSQTSLAVARREGLPIVGRFHYDPGFTQTQVQAQTVMEYDYEGLGRQIEAIWLRIEGILDQLPVASGGRQGG